MANDGSFGSGFYQKGNEGTNFKSNREGHDDSNEKFNELKSDIDSNEPMMANLEEILSAAKKIDSSETSSEDALSGTQIEEFKVETSHEEIKNDDLKLDDKEDSAQEDEIMIDAETLSMIADPSIITDSIKACDKEIAELNQRLMFLESKKAGLSELKIKRREFIANLKSFSFK